MKTDKEPDWLASEAEELRGKFKTKGFWLGKYPVTQADWEALMGNNPSGYSQGGESRNRLAGINTNRFPVERIIWVDTEQFLNKLNHPSRPISPLGKGKFALPHEDEWEYACRGGKGNDHPFYFGDAMNGTQGNCNGTAPFGDIAKGPNLQRTCPVGSYESVAPHPWGLCDMAGNVWQWCGCSSNDGHAVRGGCWNSGGRDCRAAMRPGHGPDRYDAYGFRIAFHPDRIPPSSDTQPKDAPIDTAANSIDLLASIDLSKDVIRGQWTLEKGVLTSSATPNATIEIPYEPGPAFDLHMSVRRLAGDDLVVIGLMADGHQFYAGFDGWPGAGYRSGIQYIGGQLLINNGTAKPGVQLAKGKTVELDFSIRKEFVRIWAKGEDEKGKRLVVDYTGAQNKLHLPDDLGEKKKPLNKKALFILTGGSKVEISSYRLIPFGPDAGRKIH
jgi:hypothetical protein